MTGWLLVDILLVVAMMLVARAGRLKRAQARRRSVFYGNNRGHDHEGWR